MRWSSVANLWRRALHVVLPVACGTCEVPLADDPAPFFCRACWAGIAPIAPPTCPSCGRPFASPLALTYSVDHRCGACRRRQPAFSRAWSGFRYEGALRDAIRLFKYENKVALAGVLGGLLCDAAAAVPVAADVVIPVPLHPTRLRQRGFNQSLLLADRLAHRLEMPLDYMTLRRARETPPQTELSRAARLANLRRAFELARPGAIVGSRVLLIDDVYTTGTTVNECAKTLRRGGAADVQVLTLARTI